MSNNRRTTVYISAPLSARSQNEIQKNIAKANQYAKEASAEGYLPLCPHTMFSFTDDTKLEERELALALCLDLLDLADELWLFGGKTSGMTMEYLYFKKHYPNRQIRFK